MNGVFSYFSELARVITDQVIPWLREHAPSYEIFLSERSLALATWVLAIGTLLSALVIWLVRQERQKRKEIRRQADSLIRICRVKDFDPSQVVGAYNAANVTEYLPILQDEEIERVLKEGNNVLISGRPGIGKSHTAVRHLFIYKNWLLIRPAKHVLQNLHSIRLKRRRYILLLDDLHEYIEELDSGESILDLVDHVRIQSKRLLVIATIRSTLPEFKAIDSDLKLLGRWRYFELQDWDLQRGQELAKRTHTDMRAWDGTPLSVKQPSREMEAKYRLAPYKQKAVLRVLKLLATFGIKPCPRPLLRDIYLSKNFNGESQDFESALSAIDAYGFLKKGTDLIEAYDPYLESLKDWVYDTEAYTTLRDLLVEQKRIDELLAVGKKWYGEANYNEAENIYRRCIEFKPEMERCYYRLGVVLTRKSCWPEAADNFAKATKLKPRWATAWYRLSNALNKQGKLKEGKEAFGYARSIGKADDPILRCRRAEGLRISGQLEAALAEIESVIEADSKLAEAFSVKERILEDLDRPQEAVEACREAIRLDPTMAEAHLGLGIALRKLGDDVGAEQAYQEAIRLSPTMAEAHFGLGHPLRQRGDNVGAEQAYREAIRLDPNLVDVYSQLGGLLMELGRLPEAENEFRKALSLSPDSPEFHSYLGQVLGKQRRVSEMEQEFREAILLRPDYPEALVGLAMSLRIQRKIDKAIDANLKAISLDPKLAEGHFGLGMCYASQRKWNPAANAYREATNLSPEFNAAHFYLGRTLISLNQPVEALEELKTALRVRPRSLGRITEFTQHQANGREMNERQRLAGTILKVFGQAATAIEPGDRPFHNPPFGEHNKPFALITAGDDL